MFDKYEVVRRLQNGETLDEIADSMTAALNDAANEYEQDKRKEERAKKIADMKEILDLVHDYVLEYYATSFSDIDTVNEFFSEAAAADIVDGIDDGIRDLDRFFSIVQVGPEDTKKKKKNCKGKCKCDNIPDELKELADLPNVHIMTLSDKDAEKRISSFLDDFVNNKYTN